MSGTDLGRLRREYGDHGLDVPDLEGDPISMFRRWLHDTITAGLHEPNAMVVATVGADGRPSARTVLLKGLDAGGFVFYTNYESRKAAEIDANPHVSLLFPWHDLQRQVRVDGTATRVSREESAAYFAQRPRESQLGGVLARFADTDDVPLPPFWGGFRVRPTSVEFWQGRKGRLHDRLVYVRAEDDPHAPWTVRRLAP